MSERGGEGGGGGSLNESIAPRIGVLRMRLSHAARGSRSSGYLSCIASPRLVGRQSGGRILGMLRRQMGRLAMADACP